MQDLRLAGKVWFCGKYNQKITRSVKTPFHKRNEVLRSYSWARAGVDFPRVKVAMNLRQIWLNEGILKENVM